MPPKDFTQQEQQVANILDFLGIRYAQQVEIGKYIVDFLVEDSIVLEADGFYGHYRAADKIRDMDLLQEGFAEVIHIKGSAKEKIKQEIMDALCLESAG